MGLPPRIAIPIFAVIAAVFIAIMAYFVRAGLGTQGSVLGAAATTVHEQGDARIQTTPAPIASDPPGTFAIPQSGTGPAAPSNDLPGQPVGGGGPPAPVMAELTELRGRLARNPNDLAALVAMANLYFDAQKFDQALAFYKRALALDPSNPDVRTDEATALHQTGHDLDALHDLDRVLAVRPDFAAALYNRGIVLRSIGRRTDAADAFRHFVRVAPRDPRVTDAKHNITDLGGA